MSLEKQMLLKALAKKQFQRRKEIRVEIRKKNGRNHYYLQTERLD
jgi:hypothetical protein